MRCGQKPWMLPLRRVYQRSLNIPSLFPHRDTYVQSNLEAICGRWQGLCPPGAPHSCIIPSISHKKFLFQLVEFELVIVLGAL